MTEMKWERRDRKRDKRSKMRVDGQGVRDLQRIVIEKARKLKEKEREHTD